MSREGIWSSLSVLVVIALLAAPEPASAGAMRTCYDRGYEDLKARSITCDAAERVYRQSLDAARRSGAGTTRFTRRGVRWSCRAHNPPAVAFYTWRCAAGGDRLMQYRWKSGE